MSPWLRTLVVWAVAVALGATWWWMRGGADGDDATAERVALFGSADAISIDAIDHIRLARRHEPEMEFRRVDGRWQQVKPFAVDLDEWSARQLAAEASAAVASRELAEGDAAALGFAPPAATLTLEGGGKTWSVEFGKRGVAGRAFARRGGGPIVVAEGPLYERAVEADPREWRSRVLFPDVLGRAKRVTWNLGEATMEIERKGERWSLNAPRRSRADQQRVQDIVASIARARCDGFLADAPTDLTVFGLGEGARSLTVTFEGSTGETTRRLFIGAPLGVGTSDRYAQLEGCATVVRLSVGAQAALFPHIGELFEPTGSGVRPSDVKRIEVRPTEGDAFELVRDLDHWTGARIEANATTGPALAIPNDGPDGLLHNLCIERTRRMSIEPFPVDLKVAQIILYGFDLKPLEIVRVARDKKTSEWGLENGDDAMRIYPPEFPIRLTPEEYGLTK